MSRQVLSHRSGKPLVAAGFPVQTEGSVSVTPNDRGLFAENSVGQFKQTTGLPERGRETRRLGSGGDTRQLHGSQRVRAHATPARVSTSRVRAERLCVPAAAAGPGDGGRGDRGRHLGTHLRCTRLAVKRSWAQAWFPGAEMC